jgi:predicted nucleotidyltransferase
VGIITDMTQLLPGVRREELAPPADPLQGVRLAGEAASILAEAYGARVREVVLFGSWARSQAHEESDIDLLVVLRDVADRAGETDRMVDLLYDLEADSGRAIHAFPVAQRALDDLGSFGSSARAEGIAVSRSAG